VESGTDALAERDTKSLLLKRQFGFAKWRTICAEAKMAWDREHFVSKLADKLVAIIRRRHS